MWCWLSIGELPLPLRQLCSTEWAVELLWRGAAGFLESTRAH
jgi:hypothetical protein